MNNKQDKGFTLVELLIVIVILGILATVTVFAVRGITERSQENACDVELRALATATEAYYVDNDQTWPGAWTDLNEYVKSTPDDQVWTLGADGAVTPVSGGTCTGTTL
jgi:prepilin-type N-terminal cleavage/methylation domain-containing protein